MTAIVQTAATGQIPRSTERILVIIIIRPIIAPWFKLTHRPNNYVVEFVRRMKTSASVTTTVVSSDAAADVSSISVSVIVIVITIVVVIGCAVAVVIVYVFVGRKSGDWRRLVCCVQSSGTQCHAHDALIVVIKVSRPLSELICI